MRLTTAAPPPLRFPSLSLSLFSSLSSLLKYHITPDVNGPLDDLEDGANVTTLLDGEGLIVSGRPVPLRAASFSAGCAMCVPSGGLGR